MFDWVDNVFGQADSIVTINGQDFNANKLQDVIMHGHEKNKIESAYPNPKDKQVVEYDGNYYAYLDGYWYLIRN